MVKLFILAVAVSVLSFFLAQGVAHGQTVTPTTSSPTPTTVVPTSAPATGFGPN